MFGLEIGDILAGIKFGEKPFKLRKIKVNQG
jgi:hypothetical protein